MASQKALETVLKELYDDKDIGSCAVLGTNSAQIVGVHPIPLDIWLARCHATIYHVARHGAVAAPNVRDMLMIRKKLPVAFGEFRATMLVFDNHTICLYPLPNNTVFYASVRHGADHGIPAPVLKKLRATVEKLKKLSA